MECVARGHLLGMCGKSTLLMHQGHAQGFALCRQVLLSPPHQSSPPAFNLSDGRIEASGPSKAAPVPITPLRPSIPASTYWPLDTPTIMDMMPDAGSTHWGWCHLLGRGSSLRELK